MTSIGLRAFSGCSGLTTINVESKNTNYDSRDNCNAIIETTSNTLIASCKNTNIPNSVMSIGEGSFSGLRDLTSIIIPNGVTSIGNDAFYQCSNLISITIPNSVTSIGGYAFGGCSSMLDFFSYAEYVPMTVGNAFDSFNAANATLHVPAGSVGAYLAANPWNIFREIVALTDSDPKPSGVNDVEVSDVDNGIIYDLNGRRVEHPTKGLYLKNGKKYIVK